MSAVEQTVKPTASVSSEELAALRPFRDLSPEEQLQIAGSMRSVSLLPGEHLFHVGDPFRKAVHVIRRGQMEQSWPSGDSETRFPGDFVGLASAMQATPYVTAVRALSRVELLTVPAESLEKLEETCRPLATVAYNVIAERVRDRGGGRHTTSRALAVSSRSLMKAPLITCGPEVNLAEAFGIMDERKIGGLGVTDAKGRLLGVLTYAGLSRAVLVQGARAEDNVMKVGCEVPRQVSPDAPISEVQEVLQDPAVKYVIVVEDERPLGMISQTDVLKYLIVQQGTILAEVTRAKDFTELGIQRRRIIRLAREALDHNREASAAARIVSEFHLALQRRCAELTQAQMKRKGLGSPPAPYCLIIMGSGARKEMFLNPDQDNGLIIADAPEAETKRARKWFQTFSEALNEHLHEVGYPLCPGNIMARNPDFHKTLGQWKKQFSHVIANPTEKAARWAHVVLEFDMLYGEASLAAELRSHVYRTLRENSRLLTLMVKDDAEGRPPLGLFNRLITLSEDKGKEAKGSSKKGKIDIKRNGLRILADAARIYALRAGIGARNTIERLNSLVRQDVLTRESVASAQEAYQTLMEMLLTHQIRQMEQGDPPDKLIKPKQLTPIEHENLRLAMLVIKRFQEKLQADFNTVVF